MKTITKKYIIKRYKAIIYILHNMVGRFLLPKEEFINIGNKIKNTDTGHRLWVVIE